MELIWECIAFNLGHPVWELCVCHYEGQAAWLQTECAIAAPFLEVLRAPTMLP